MIVEIGISIALFYGVNYLRSDTRKFVKTFDSVMEGLGLKNKVDSTFAIKDIESTKNGYKAIVTIPKGLSVDSLNNKLNVLEDNLNAIINIDKPKFSPYITLRVVNRDISKFWFKPVKCKADKLYIGKDYRGESYFIDLNTNPMVLIAGATGYGKSMLLASLLTNLIYNSSKDVELYLTQLIKGEIASFSDCSSVRFTAYTEDELTIAAEKVRKKIDDRTKLFKEYGIRNIIQWNKHFPRRRLKRVILVCEEMSELMELDVWSELWSIVKAGRSVGVHLIGALQRTTATNLDTNVKSQMTRITFHQNSIIDSQNVINSNSALELNRGECIVCGNKGEVKIKVPFIDDDFVVLNKFVPDIIIPSKDRKIIKEEKLNKPKQIEIIEKPTIIDIEPKDIKEVKKIKKGVVKLEDIKNADRKR